jgi:hypothetical protein
MTPGAAQTTRFSWCRRASPRVGDGGLRIVGVQIDLTHDLDLAYGETGWEFDVSGLVCRRVQANRVGLSWRWQS